MFSFCSLRSYSVEMFCSVSYNLLYILQALLQVIVAYIVQNRRFILHKNVVFTFCSGR